MAGTQKVKGLDDDFSFSSWGDFQIPRYRGYLCFDSYGCPLHVFMTKYENIIHITHVIKTNMYQLDYLYRTRASFVSRYSITRNPAIMLEPC